jgi:hypothetical protein
MMACTKQTPDQPPGTAIITNLKSALHVAQVATASAKDAIPALMTNADAEDVATANAILKDVDTALGVLNAKLAPYSSFDTSNQAQIKQAVADTLAALKDLQAERVTHIKNAKLEARVNLGLNLASGALSLWNPPAPDAA